jgi:hypothetical protein
MASTTETLSHAIHEPESTPQAVEPSHSAAESFRDGLRDGMIAGQEEASQEGTALQGPYTREITQEERDFIASTPSFEAGPVRTSSVQRTVFATLGGAGVAGASVGAIGLVGKGIHHLMKKPQIPAGLKIAANAAALAVIAYGGYRGWSAAQKAAKSGEQIDNTLDAAMKNGLPDMTEKTINGIAGATLVSTPGWVTAEAASVAGHVVAGAATGYAAGNAVHALLPAMPGYVSVPLRVLEVGAGAVIGGLTGVANTTDRLERDQRILQPAIESRLENRIATQLTAQGMDFSFVEQLLNREAASEQEAAVPGR